MFIFQPFLSEPLLVIILLEDPNYIFTSVGKGITLSFLTSFSKLSKSNHCDQHHMFITVFEFLSYNLINQKKIE